MKNVIVTNAIELDLNDLLKIEHECFEYDRIKRNKFKQLIRSSWRARVYVALHKREFLCGYAIVQYPKDKQYARLYSIASRMRGVGRLLLRDAEIRSTNVVHRRTEMRLEVDEENVRAIKFYRKAGYEQFGRYKNYYENGHAAFRFKKRIDRPAMVVFDGNTWIPHEQRIGE
jgi:ribosomal protein S18 acetylase RimI-like enzyme